MKECPQHIKDRLLEEVKKLKFEDESDEDTLRIILNPLHKITDIDYKLFFAWLKRSEDEFCPSFDPELHKPDTVEE